MSPIPPGSRSLCVWPTHNAGTVGLPHHFGFLKDNSATSPHSGQHNSSRRLWPWMCAMNRLSGLLIRSIHEVATASRREQSDGELVEQFANASDAAAFATLVQRHGS